MRSIKYLIMVLFALLMISGCNSEGNSGGDDSGADDGGPPAEIFIGVISPETIGVAGSGISNTSIITFLVNDISDNPVPDFHLITFNISTPLGGGRKIISN